MVDQLVDPGVETPYHVHHNEEELFYVLDGEIDCFYGADAEERIRAGPGETVHLPRDILHAIRVVSKNPCRLLALVAPAGVEELWIEAGEPAPELTTPPPPGGASGPRGACTALRTVRRRGVRANPD